MSAGARGSWTLVAATAALALSACEPVAIYGRIVPEGEPVRVVPGEGELGGIAVGLLDEHTLVEWMRPGEEHLVVPTIQWLDSDLRPARAPLELGLGTRLPSQWVREETPSWHRFGQRRPSTSRCAMTSGSTCGELRVRPDCHRRSPWQSTRR
ncbi:MAG: hypothetical protein M5U28_54660 [Sandaracinaceae bacterium]|nr:hypothetical protein [Sandaracinaceae bacterium]